MRSRSDSEPTRIPTTGSDMGDIPAELHAGEIYVRGGVVCGSPRVGERVSERGDVQDAAAVRHDATVVECRPGVEDERAGCLGLLDPLDRRPRVAALRVV